MAALGRRPVRTSDGLEHCENGGQITRYTDHTKPRHQQTHVSCDKCGLNCPTLNRRLAANATIPKNRR